MNVRFFSTMAVALLLLSTTATHAQTNALVMASTTLDRNANETSSVAYLKDDKMVTESEDGKHTSTVIFDAKEETMYIINHKKKEYTEMTRQDMEAMSAMLEEQLSAMEQQLEMLPEKQRDMVRKQVESAFGGSKKVTEYTKEESGIAVNDWTTDKYVSLADGEKQSEIYIAGYQQLGLQADQFKTLDKFFDAMKNYMQSMTKNMPSAAFGFFSENMPDYKDGIPVKTIIYNSKGEAISTSTISNVEEKQVDEELFIIPEKYKKKEISQAFMD